MGKWAPFSPLAAFPPRNTHARVLPSFGRTPDSSLGATVGRSRGRRSVGYDAKMQICRWTKPRAPFGKIVREGEGPTQYPTDVRPQDFQLTRPARLPRSSLVLGLLARRLTSIKHCTGHGDSRVMFTLYRVMEKGGEHFDAFVLQAYDPHTRSSFAYEIGEQRRIFPSHNSGSGSPKPVN